MDFSSLRGLFGGGGGTPVYGVGPGQGFNAQGQITPQMTLGGGGGGMSPAIMGLLGAGSALSQAGQPTYGPPVATGQALLAGMGGGLGGLLGAQQMNQDQAEQDRMKRLYEQILMGQLGTGAGAAPASVIGLGGLY